MAAQGREGDVKAFFVICQAACPTCQGAGVVANALWARFFKETGGAGDPQAWARDAGFASALEMGAEAEPCQDCEGVALVQRLVPLQEALQALPPL
jgi:hypothetical protein